jgi:hypothetical protein
MRLACGKRSEKLRATGILQERSMKLFTGWVVSAGLVLTAAAANAQVLVPYRSGYVSDFQGPYAAMPPDAAVPRYGYGDGPTLLPPQEVYTVLRDGGFSPLGVPQLRGFVYTIAVIDRGGENGRLAIDARTGRILRFMPGYRIGNNPGEDMPAAYGPSGPSPVGQTRGAPRPPASIPHLASRSPSAVPLPKATPPHADAKPQAAEPGPQQAAAAQAKPADTATAPPAAAPAAVAAKPAAPPILPTQEMPKAQGLD